MPSCTHCLMFCPSYGKKFVLGIAKIISRLITITNMFLLVLYILFSKSLILKLKLFFKHFLLFHTTTKAKFRVPFTEINPLVNAKALVSLKHLSIPFFLAIAQAKAHTILRVIGKPPLAIYFIYSTKPVPHRH